MAIFGRKTARQRLRSAARQSLAIPAFSAPTDCTPWVLDGLWPAELSTVTDRTAALAEYLDADLRRIANSANEKLQEINRSGLTGSARRAAESRAIEVARAFAVLRVESTVRQLHDEAARLPAGDLDWSPGPGPDTRHPTEELAVFTPEPQPTGEYPGDPGHRSPKPTAIEPIEPPVPEAVEPAQLPEPAETAHEPDEQTDSAPAEPESDSRRLQRLLQFVARQEPGLRWAIGVRHDGSTVLVSDLAHGWIPPGIELPSAVRLPEPGWHVGNAAALLGSVTASAAYAPGDRLGWATEFGPTETSVQPRELPVIENLGWVLAGATHWRDGLPGLVHTLARAGAAGTGVADAEVDLLRVHLDTARYQLLAQYPDVDNPLLLNCMLLAATVGIATGDTVSANYHFAWFQALSTPPRSVVEGSPMN